MAKKEVDVDAKGMNEIVDDYLKQNKNIRMFTRLGIHSFIRSKGGNKSYNFRGPENEV